MPINKSDVLKIREESGTIGGVTYWITRKDDPDQEEKSLCFRVLNGVDNRGKGFRCNRPAGMNTTHYGTGACKLHGGNNELSTLKTGKSAVLTRTILQDKIEEFLDGDSADLTNLTVELATLRAIFSEFLENFPKYEGDLTKTEAVDYGVALARAMKLTSSISSLLEKISKIEARNTLTAAQALYLQATVADILLKHISDPNNRDRAVRELTNRMSGVDLNRIGVVQKNTWTAEESQ
jgi:hypothetical protein